jgi:hypothetical protein
MKSTEDEDHKVPDDPPTADKAAWKKYWDDARREEQQSDEDTRQLIEEGRRIWKQRFLVFLRQWRSRLLEKTNTPEPQELRETLELLSVEAEKIQRHGKDTDFDKMYDAVHRACAERDTRDTTLDRQKIVDAIAALIDFVERT